MKNEECTKGKNVESQTSRSSFFLLPSSFVLVLLLALAVRLPHLGARPMHTDEAVNAYLTGQLLAGQPYHYDPTDRHGPALFAIAQPLAELCGARHFSDLTEFELRLGPAIIGAVTVLLFSAGVEMFGLTACLVAALLFAVSPLPVYYSRYFIHETLFVAATLGLMLSGWRMLCGTSGERKPWIPGAVAGFCAALMLACKETAPLHFLALGIAALAGFFLPPRSKMPSLKFVAVAAGVFAIVTVLLFTWFGKNWAVFADLVHAVPNFAARAGGAGHQKPFGYYFHLIDPMVVLTLVAVGGAYAAICDAVGGVRKAPVMLCIYGLVIFLMYSGIPYKTPWLALNLWLPLSLMCGLGVAAFKEQISNAAGRWVVVVAGAFLLALLALETKVLVFDRPADEKNPLAYAHTSEDLLGLAPRLGQLVAENNLKQPRIAVVAADPWPLPWYLRKFAQVGYWQPGQDTGPATFFITPSDLPDSLTAPFKDFRPEFFGARPGVLFILWIPPGLKISP
jgi:uncharacterized protein (TIGR03663 family)